jgi:hypothetical protein
MFVQSQMCPGLMIVAQEAADYVSEMGLAEHDGSLFILLVILYLRSEVHEAHRNPPRRDERGVMGPFSARKTDPCR